ncbi:2-dehydro-3-deoxy-D-gluconate 5-dehydrogenase KduD [Bacillus tamaricis]|uniref:2-dehydro-3-deoxy-D-gluconate 5-dehydrogenase KduD n=2 Tax=Evansella tamaricis TaxID=2069301 RepID=A0ABS6JD84_9BACI|nr:2-dehydro-3-deoxy-D-gluconate 5-dehydrogenase KduD [Evansella tamaricis]MBU9711628.1 2-dehydro-3-deoxy-D-gluconate 5-dehydrogenase KduD [Evansella tamaricis]
MGKTALVTGASRGLGQGMSVGLAEAGADVIGVGISDMSETRKKIEALGQKFYEIKGDLSKANAVTKIVTESIQEAGKIHILVNNAGIIRRKEAENFSDQDWDDVVQVNLNSVFRLSREVGKHMLGNGEGKIINIASMLSFQGGLRVPAYTATKHAVAGLTKSLANEWASKGISVNAIAPGYMITDNTAPLRENEVRNDFITSRIPIGEWGTPDDLKGPVVFLASEASRYVTGHVLCVDGGWMSS